jgi:hypothetical protein
MIPTIGGWPGASALTRAASLLESYIIKMSLAALMGGFTLLKPRSGCTDGMSFEHFTHYDSRSLRFEFVAGGVTGHHSALRLGHLPTYSYMAALPPLPVPGSVQIRVPVSAT